LGLDTVANLKLSGEEEAKFTPVDKIPAQYRQKIAEIDQALFRLTEGQKTEAPQKVETDRKLNEEAARQEQERAAQIKAAQDKDTERAKDILEIRKSLAEIRAILDYEIGPQREARLKGLLTALSGKTMAREDIDKLFTLFISEGGRFLMPAYLPKEDDGPIGKVLGAVQSVTTGLVNDWVAERQGHELTGEDWEERRAPLGEFWLKLVLEKIEPNDLAERLMSALLNPKGRKAFRNGYPDVAYPEQMTAARALGYLGQWGYLGEGAKGRLITYLKEQDSRYTTVKNEIIIALGQMKDSRLAEAVINDVVGPRASRAYKWLYSARTDEEFGAIEALRWALGEIGGVNGAIAFVGVESVSRSVFISPEPFSLKKFNKEEIEEAVKQIRENPRLNTLLKTAKKMIPVNESAGGQLKEADRRTAPKGTEREKSVEAEIKTPQLTEVRVSDTQVKYLYGPFKQKFDATVNLPDIKQPFILNEYEQVNMTTTIEQREDGYYKVTTFEKESVIPIRIKAGFDALGQNDIAVAEHIYNQLPEEGKNSPRGKELKQAIDEAKFRKQTAEEEARRQQERAAQIKTAQDIAGKIAALDVGKSSDLGALEKEITRLSGQAAKDNPEAEAIVSEAAAKKRIEIKSESQKDIIEQEANKKASAIEARPEVTYKDKRGLKVLPVVAESRTVQEAAVPKEPKEKQKVEKRLKEGQISAKKVVAPKTEQPRSLPKPAPQPQAKERLLKDLSKQDAPEVEKYIVIVKKGDTWGRIVIEYSKKFGLSWKPLWSLKGKALERWIQVKGGEPNMVNYKLMDRLHLGERIEFILQARVKKQESQDRPSLRIDPFKVPKAFRDIPAEAEESKAIPLQPAKPATPSRESIKPEQEEKISLDQAWPPSTREASLLRIRGPPVKVQHGIEGLREISTYFERANLDLIRISHQESSHKTIRQLEQLGIGLASKLRILISLTLPKEYFKERKGDLERFNNISSEFFKRQLTIFTDGSRLRQKISREINKKRIELAKTHKENIKEEIDESRRILEAKKLLDTIQEELMASHAEDPFEFGYIYIYDLGMYLQLLVRSGYTGKAKIILEAISKLWGRGKDGYYRGYSLEDGLRADITKNPGDISYLILGILAYTDAYTTDVGKDKQFLDIAKNLIDYLVDKFWVPGKAGAVEGFRWTILEKEHPVNYHRLSTENNISMYAAMRRFAKVSGDKNAYLYQRNKIEELVIKSYQHFPENERGLFSAGYDLREERFNDITPSDVPALAILAFGRDKLKSMGIDADKVLLKAKETFAVEMQHHIVSGEETYGYDFVSEKGAIRERFANYDKIHRFRADKTRTISHEWSLFFALANGKDSEEGKAILESIEKNALNNGVVPYASDEGVETGFGFSTPYGRKSLISTLWYYLAKDGINIFEDTQKEITNGQEIVEIIKKNFTYTYEKHRRMEIEAILRSAFNIPFYAQDEIMRLQRILSEKNLSRKDIFDLFNMAIAYPAPSGGLLNILGGRNAFVGLTIAPSGWALGDFIGSAFDAFKNGAGIGNIATMGLSLLAMHNMKLHEKTAQFGGVIHFKGKGLDLKLVNPRLGINKYYYKDAEGKEQVDRALQITDPLAIPTEIIQSIIKILGGREIRHFKTVAVVSNSVQQAVNAAMFNEDNKALYFAYRQDKDLVIYKVVKSADGKVRLFELARQLMFYPLDYVSKYGFETYTFLKSVGMWLEERQIIPLFSIKRFIETRKIQEAILNEKLYGGLIEFPSAEVSFIDSLGMIPLSVSIGRARFTLDSKLLTASLNMGLIRYFMKTGVTGKVDARVLFNGDEVGISYRGKEVSGGFQVISDIKESSGKEEVVEYQYLRKQGGNRKTLIQKGQKYAEVSESRYYVAGKPIAFVFERKVNVPEALIYTFRSLGGELPSTYAVYKYTDPRLDSIVTLSKPINMQVQFTGFSLPLDITLNPGTIVSVHPDHFWKDEQGAPYAAVVEFVRDEKHLKSFAKLLPVSSDGEVIYLDTPPMGVTRTEEKINVGELKPRSFKDEINGLRNDPRVQGIEQAVKDLQGLNQQYINEIIRTRNSDRVIKDNAGLRRLFERINSQLPERAEGLRNYFGNVYYYEYLRQGLLNQPPLDNQKQLSDAEKEIRDYNTANEDIKLILEEVRMGMGSYLKAKGSLLEQQKEIVQLGEEIQAKKNSISRDIETLEQQLQDSWIPEIVSRAVISGLRNYMPDVYIFPDEKIMEILNPRERFVDMAMRQYKEYGTFGAAWTVNLLRAAGFDIDFATWGAGVTGDTNSGGTGIILRKEGEKWVYVGKAGLDRHYTEDTEYRMVLFNALGMNLSETMALSYAGFFDFSVKDKGLIQLHNVELKNEAVKGFFWSLKGTLGDLFKKGTEVLTWEEYDNELKKGKRINKSVDLKTLSQYYDVGFDIGYKFSEDKKGFVRLGFKKDSSKFFPEDGVYVGAGISWKLPYDILLQMGADSTGRTTIKLEYDLAGMPLELQMRYYNGDIAGGVSVNFGDLLKLGLDIRLEIGHNEKGPHIGVTIGKKADGKPEMLSTGRSVSAEEEIWSQFYRFFPQNPKLTIIDGLPEVIKIRNSYVVTGDGKGNFRLYKVVYSPKALEYESFLEEWGSEYKQGSNPERFAEKKFLRTKSLKYLKEQQLKAAEINTEISGENKYYYILDKTHPGKRIYLNPLVKNGKFNPEEVNDDAEYILIIPEGRNPAFIELGIKGLEESIRIYNAEGMVYGDDINYILKDGDLSRAITESKLYAQRDKDKNLVLTVRDFAGIKEGILELGAKGLKILREAEENSYATLLNYTTGQIVFIAKQDGMPNSALYILSHNEDMPFGYRLTVPTTEELKQRLQHSLTDVVVELRNGNRVLWLVDPSLRIRGEDITKPMLYAHSKLAKIEIGINPKERTISLPKGIKLGGETFNLFDITPLHRDTVITQKAVFAGEERKIEVKLPKNSLVIKNKETGEIQHVISGSLPYRLFTDYLNRNALTLRIEKDKMVLVEAGGPGRMLIIGMNDAADYYDKLKILANKLGFSDIDDFEKTYYGAVFSIEEGREGLVVLSDLAKEFIIPIEYKDDVGRRILELLDISGERPLVLYKQVLADENSAAVNVEGKRKAEMVFLPSTNLDKLWKSAVKYAKSKGKDGVTQELFKEIFDKEKKFIIGKSEKISIDKFIEILGKTPELLQVKGESQLKNLIKTYIAYTQDKLGFKFKFKRLNAADEKAFDIMSQLDFSLITPVNPLTKTKLFYSLQGFHYGSSRNYLEVKSMDKQLYMDLRVFKDGKEYSLRYNLADIRFNPEAISLRQEIKDNPEYSVSVLVLNMSKKLLFVELRDKEGILKDIVHFRFEDLLSEFYRKEYINNGADYLHYSRKLIEEFPKINFAGNKIQYNKKVIHPERTEHIKYEVSKDAPANLDIPLKPVLLKSLNVFGGVDTKYHLNGDSIGIGQSELKGIDWLSGIIEADEQSTFYNKKKEKAQVNGTVFRDLSNGEVLFRHTEGKIDGDKDLFERIKQMFPTTFGLDSIEPGKDFKVDICIADFNEHGIGKKSLVLINDKPKKQSLYIDRGRLDFAFLVFTGDFKKFEDGVKDLPILEKYKVIKDKLENLRPSTIKSVDLEFKSGRGRVDRTLAHPKYIGKGGLAQEKVKELLSEYQIGIPEVSTTKITPPSNEAIEFRFEAGQWKLYIGKEKIVLSGIGINYYGNHPPDYFYDNFTQVLSAFASFVQDNPELARFNSFKIFLPPTKLSQEDKDSARDILLKIHSLYGARFMFVLPSGQGLRDEKGELVLGRKSNAVAEKDKAVVREIMQDYASWTKGFGDALVGVQLFNEANYFVLGGRFSEDNRFGEVRLNFNFRDFVRFANEMKKEYEKQDKGRLIMLGLGDLSPEEISLLKREGLSFDALALNLYPKQANLKSYYKKYADRLKVLNKPVVISEFGKSSYSSSETEQAKFIADSIDAIKKYFAGYFVHELFPNKYKLLISKEEPDYSIVKEQKNGGIKFAFKEGVESWLKNLPENKRRKADTEPLKVPVVMEQRQLRTDVLGNFKNGIIPEANDLFNLQKLPLDVLERVVFGDIYFYDFTIKALNAVTLSTIHQGVSSRVWGFTAEPVKTQFIDKYISEDERNKVYSAVETLVKGWDGEFEQSYGIHRDIRTLLNRHNILSLRLLDYDSMGLSQESKNVYFPFRVFSNKEGDELLVYSYVDFNGITHARISFYPQVKLAKGKVDYHIKGYQQSNLDLIGKSFFTIWRSDLGEDAITGSLEKSVLTQVFLGELIENKDGYIRTDITYREARPGSFFPDRENGPEAIWNTFKLTYKNGEYDDESQLHLREELENEAIGIFKDPINWAKGNIFITIVLGFIFAALLIGVRILPWLRRIGVFSSKYKSIPYLRNHLTEDEIREELSKATNIFNFDADKVQAAAKAFEEILRWGEVRQNDGRIRSRSLEFFEAYRRFRRTFGLDGDAWYQVNFSANFDDLWLFLLCEKQLGILRTSNFEAFWVFIHLAFLMRQQGRDDEIGPFIKEIHNIFTGILGETEGAFKAVRYGAYANLLPIDYIFMQESLAGMFKDKGFILAFIRFIQSEEDQAKYRELHEGLKEAKKKAHAAADRIGIKGATPRKIAKDAFSETKECKEYKKYYKGIQTEQVIPAVDENGQLLPGVKYPLIFNTYSYRAGEGSWLTGLIHSIVKHFGPSVVMSLLPVAVTMAYCLMDKLTQQSWLISGGVALASGVAFCGILTAIHYFMKAFINRRLSAKWFYGASFILSLGLFANLFLYYIGQLPVWCFAISLGPIVLIGLITGIRVLINHQSYADFIPLFVKNFKKHGLSFNPLDVGRRPTDYRNDKNSLEPHRAIRWSILFVMIIAKFAWNYFLFQYAVIPLISFWGGVFLLPMSQYTLGGILAFMSSCNLGILTIIAALLPLISFCLLDNFSVFSLIEAIIGFSYVSYHGEGIVKGSRIISRRGYRHSITKESDDFIRLMKEKLAPVSHEASSPILTEDQKNVLVARQLIIQLDRWAMVPDISPPEYEQQPLVKKFKDNEAVFKGENGIFAVKVSDEELKRLMGYYLKLSLPKERERERDEFLTSLFMDSPDMPSRKEQVPFTYMTPINDEPLCYRYEMLRKRLNSGITTLGYLGKLRHSRSWKYLMEELESKYKGKYDKELKQLRELGLIKQLPEDLPDELRERIERWASLKFQAFYMNLVGLQDAIRNMKLLYRVEHPEASDWEAGQAIAETMQILIGYQPYFDILGDKKKMDGDQGHYLRFFEKVITEIFEEEGYAINFSAVRSPNTATGDPAEIILYTVEKTSLGVAKIKQEMSLKYNMYHPIVSEGKPCNQSATRNFAWKELIYAVDLNQNHPPGTSIRLPQLAMLANVHNDIVCIGTPEEIVTEHHSVNARNHANSDGPFCGIVKPVLYLCKALFHYGHPDFIRNSYAMTHGGVSALHFVNEDIFFGYFALLMGKAIAFALFLRPLKTREGSFNMTAGFFGKLGMGAIEQSHSGTLSDLYNSPHFDFAQKAIHYHGAIGFFIRKLPILILAAAPYLHIVFLLGISIFVAFPSQLSTAFIGIILLAQAVTLAGYMYTMVRKSFVLGTVYFVMLLLLMAPFYMAQIGVYASGAMLAMQGIAKYVNTGRGFNLEHTSAAEITQNYSFGILFGAFHSAIAALGLWLWWNPQLGWSFAVIALVVSLFLVPYISVKTFILPREIDNVKHFAWLALDLVLLALVDWWCFITDLISRGEAIKDEIKALIKDHEEGKISNPRFKIKLFFLRYLAPFLPIKVIYNNLNPQWIWPRTISGFIYAFSTILFKLLLSIPLMATTLMGSIAALLFGLASRVLSLLYLFTRMPRMLLTISALAVPTIVFFGWPYLSSHLSTFMVYIMQSAEVLWSIASHIIPEIASIITSAIAYIPPAVIWNLFTGLFNIIYSLTQSSVHYLLAYPLRAAFIWSGLALLGIIYLTYRIKIEELKKKVLKKLGEKATTARRLAANLLSAAIQFAVRRSKKENANSLSSIRNEPGKANSEHKNMPPEESSSPLAPGALAPPYGKTSSPIESSTSLRERFKEKMLKEGLEQLVIDTFLHYYGLLLTGATGMISKQEIDPIKEGELPDASSLGSLEQEAGRAALSKTVVIKLNGGLGTGMGLERAKSLLPVKDNNTFLDIIARQILALREEYGINLPIIFMNSFSTEEDTLEALKAYPELPLSGLPLSFVQHKFPKIDQKDLSPIAWPADPELEWNPPGHGDIYTSLITTGMLDKLLNMGYRYALISNSDNLGALLDELLLGYFANGNYPFMMEVADRTPADRKGGHLARLKNGNLTLRESAQCPKEEEEEFQNITLYRYFNTNTIWVNLQALKEKLLAQNNVLRLSLIKNSKTVDPRDDKSLKVYQLETAMGAAISVFKGATAMRVFKTRFAPVKSCSDLLGLWSDCYKLTPEGLIVLNPARKIKLPVVVILDSHYKMIDQLQARFPHGAPSLVNCGSLTINGDVLFGPNVTIQGENITITNSTNKQVTIPAGEIITGDKNIASSPLAPGALTRTLTWDEQARRNGIAGLAANLNHAPSASSSPIVSGTPMDNSTSSFRSSSPVDLDNFLIIRERMFRKDYEKFKERLDRRKADLIIEKIEFLLSYWRQELLEMSGLCDIETISSNFLVNVEKWFSEEDYIQYVNKFMSTKSIPIGKILVPHSIILYGRTIDKLIDIDNIWDELGEEILKSMFGHEITHALVMLKIILVQLDLIPHQIGWPEASIINEEERLERVVSRYVIEQNGLRPLALLLWFGHHFEPLSITHPQARTNRDFHRALAGDSFAKLFDLDLHEIEQTLDIIIETERQYQRLAESCRNSSPLVKNSSSAITIDSLIPSLARIDISSVRDNNTLILTNDKNGKTFTVGLISHKDKQYLRIGNATYLVVSEKINLTRLNPLGNPGWQKFVGINLKDMPVEACLIRIPLDPAGEPSGLRLFPANHLLHPGLRPQSVSEQTLQAARNFLDSISNQSNLLEIIHMAIIAGIHGNWHDYKYAIQALNQILSNQDLVQNKELIISVIDYIYLAYSGCDWQKWEKIGYTLRHPDKTSTAQSTRPQSLFERRVEPTRLPVPAEELGNWEVIGAEALTEQDLDYIPNDPSSREVQLGRASIKSGKVPAVPFCGGAATTVKKIMGKNKLVHKALFAVVEKAGTRIRVWISIIQARIGLLLGQHPLSRIVIATSVGGTLEGESDLSTRELLEGRYPKELERGQIRVVIQRNGLVLDPKTGMPLRFEDGRIATCAENHLWSFLAVLLDKDLVIDLLTHTDGIVSAGNGDNILNYTREGMIGKILAARAAGKPVATVAVCTASAGDKKGGFAVRITYRNKVTGQEMTRTEFREVSEFPTRDQSETKFDTKIDLTKEKDTEFFRQCASNNWFIEDIFGNKRVAFNVAFYAVDMKLVIARIFSLDERGPAFLDRLKMIEAQAWADRILYFGEMVPRTIQPAKNVPNEDNSAKVTGYITEQAVQDLIVNALGLLGHKESVPYVEILLVDRKDIFLPYKGTKQSIIDRQGNEVVDLVSGRAITADYDLISNQERYSGVIEELAANGHHCVLGAGEKVGLIIPVKDLEEIKKANKESSAPLGALMRTLTWDEQGRLNEISGLKGHRIIIRPVIDNLLSNTSSPIIVATVMTRQTTEEFMPEMRELV
ncbi:MAG: UTP--glucose-1-phosphate uridylyltransferase, partial [Candidatus Omnitrophica bacterium]|nr:UTP--glucose-1-phosphate uridylyltransferase [Candidatus Omnitrophota bacterium]